MYRRRTAFPATVFAPGRSSGLPGVVARALRRCAGLAALALLVQSGAVSANYAEHPAAQALIAEMVQEHGFDASELTALMAAAERQQSILDAIARPAEKTKPWYEYREIFLTERREREGVAFLNEHRGTLSRAQAETGVPAEIIVAILGVETYYGRITGSYAVLDALSTLAFDYPKRSKFFTGELKSFLLLTREQGLDPLELKGSYAGAMGYGQFISSSYRAYAVDFDGDGVADIWHNPVDAIGSVANYFARNGWRAGEPVVTRADFSASGDPAIFDGELKPTKTVAGLASQGLVAAQALDGDALATAVRFEQPDAFDYWMGLHNFYVITRYNRSNMYAMAVFQLSQRIAMGARE